MTKKKQSRLTLWQSAVLGLTLTGYAALVGILGRAEASKATPPPVTPSPQSPQRLEVQPVVGTLPPLQVRELPPLAVTPVPLSTADLPPLTVETTKARSLTTGASLQAQPVVGPLPTLPPVQVQPIPTVAPVQVQAPSPAVVVRPVVRSRGS